jgi:type I restriction enzyme S subunit
LKPSLPLKPSLRTQRSGVKQSVNENSEADCFVPRNDGPLTPKLRFKEFEGDWEKYSLKYLLDSLVDCEHKTAPYVDQSEYLVVRTNNVKGGQLLYNDIKYTTEEGFKEWTKRTTPQFGDIFFTREAPAGESCLVPKDKKVCLGQRMVLLKSDEKKMIGQYLSSYLQSGSAIRDISNLSIGTTVTRINITDIYKLKCPVSSLPEQQKIASFLSAVDEKIQQLSKKKELLEHYKKGVMQQLFSQQLRFKDKEGEDYPDWEEKKLGEIATKASSNISANTIEENQGEYKIYGASGFLKKIDFFREEKPFISIVKDGAGVGRTLLCDANSSVLGTLDIIKPKVKVELYFLYSVLNNVKFEKYMVGSTIPHIYYKDYSNEKITIPCLEEQQKIAFYLSSIDVKIESVAQQIEKTRGFKKGLLQQMFV